MEYNLDTNFIIGCLLYCILLVNSISDATREHDAKPHQQQSLEFHVSTSTGNANSNSVRLNSPLGWVPVGPLEENYVQITMEVPVLLTGVLLQGGVKSQGRIHKGSLRLSLDCQTYTTENFSTSVDASSEDIVPIYLHKLAFVRCIRLVPSKSIGHEPGLRLDLLGCVVRKQLLCSSSITDEKMKEISSRSPTAAPQFITQKTPPSAEVLYEMENSSLETTKNKYYTTTPRAHLLESLKLTTPPIKDTKANRNGETDQKQNNEQYLPQKYPIAATTKPSKDGQSATLTTHGQALNLSVESSHSGSNKNDSDEDVSTKEVDTVVLFNEQIMDTSKDEESVNNSTDIKKNKSGCGTKPSSDLHHRHKRVVQGRPNLPNEWPWLVSLHYLPELNFTRRSGYKHVCGANLIAPDWLLSAGHCFSDDVIPGLSNLSDWEVYIGLHDQATKDVDSNIQARNITKVILHADSDVVFNPFKADLSLIKLDRPVTFTPNASPICLDDTELFYKDATCYVTGWGQQAFRGGKGSRIPYTAPLSVLTLQECKTKYDALMAEDHEFSFFVYVEDPVICAYGDTGEDSCLGDSGGPLMCKVDENWVLAGIVSGGYECGMNGFPGFYSRVSYYGDWIRKQMALHSD